MSPELSEKLVRQFPRIFRQDQASYQFIFEIDDGWYNIIEQLCRQIQLSINASRDGVASKLKYNRKLQRAINGDIEPLIAYYKSSGDLNDRVMNTVKSILMNPKPYKGLKPIPQFKAIQIKEKFGILRIYYDGGNEVIEGLVAFAERMSSVTCEICGDAAVGADSHAGWHMTLCKKHQHLRDGHENTF